MPIDDLSVMQRQRLEMLLRGADIRFEMSGDVVWFPVAAEVTVGGLLEDVRAMGGDGADRQQQRTTSRVRADRRVVTPRIESGAEESAEFASAWPRGFARLIDGWMIAIAGALYNVFLTPIPYVTWVFLVALFASFEWVFGRTPGKAVLGLRVQSVDGGRASLAAVLVRNAWQLLGLIPVLGGWVSLAAAGVIGLLVQRSPVRRGPHDLLGQTAVVRTREPVRRRVLASERSKRSDRKASVRSDLGP